MKRRGFLRRTGASVGATALVAGCSTTSSSDNTLTVAAYSSFTGEGTAGNWLKSAFDPERDEASIEFITPENGFNQFIQRAQQDAEINADVYVGLNTGELVRADQELDRQLLAPVAAEIDGVAGIKQGLNIDPDNRAIPYDTGYISLVYDENKVEEPATFDTLIQPAYAESLITQNAQQSDPGRAFLLWSIISKGADGYLSYWESLIKNGVTVISDWESAYEAYANEEAPMIVSYSTDQVFYHGPNVDISRHQVGFLNDQGYANPETMAMFSGTDNPELAKEFMEFMLTETAQSEIAMRNVQFPAVADVSVSEEFDTYAIEPPNPVTLGYDDLSGNVETWIADWAQLVATN